MAKIVGQAGEVSFTMEEGILTKDEGAKFVHVGTTKFENDYKVCARDQGGKNITYLKSDLYRRYLENTGGPREVSE